MPTTSAVIGCYNHQQKGEFLKILNMAVVGWLLLIEEVRMESYGFLVMATMFAPATLYLTKIRYTN